MKKKILFVCTYNEIRSKTAEIIFKKYKSIEVKSCGLDRSANTVCNKNSYLWADIIIVMEEVHKKIIEEKYPEFKNKIKVINVPSNYYFMETELIELLKIKVKKVLEEEGIFLE